MKRKQATSSNSDTEHLRRMKYASVESKFNALMNMIRFTKEAQKSCKQRGAAYHPAFPED